MNLFDGSNLDIMKKEIFYDADDFIYLNTPFLSIRNCNNIFRPEKDSIKCATIQNELIECTK